MALLQCFI